MLKFEEGEAVAYWKDRPDKRVFGYDNNPGMYKNAVHKCRTLIAKVTIDDHDHPVGYIEEDIHEGWHGLVNWATDSRFYSKHLDEVKAHIVTVFAMEDLYDKYLALHADIPY